MVKRKNPLKNLDAFLKQEASSLVNPQEIKAGPASAPPRVSDPEESMETPPSRENILQQLDALAGQEGSRFRNSLYTIIRETLENLGSPSSEDKMLINTILYLNDKVNWKENIKAYWSK